VLFAEPDPSFIQMASVLSPTYAETMGPATGGRMMWPVIDVGPGRTNEDFVRDLRADYVGDGIDPLVKFAEGSQDLIDSTHDADVLVSERTRIDAETLAQFGSRLRLIQRFGSWVPAVDVNAAADHGIMVASWRRSANRRVAEHTVMLMLALARRLVTSDNAVRTFDMDHYADHKPETSYTNNWVRLTNSMTLAGKSLGVIGLGEVGAEVALLAQGLDMRVCYTQRNRNELLERQLGVEYRPLDELLAGCDVVSLHLPLNESTTGFLASDQLKLMRSSSLLVNVSRGALVDEAALVDALGSGTIAGAAFDTFWHEPLDPMHPMLDLPNVIVTPHVASGAVNAELFRSEFSGPLTNIARVLTGRLPCGVVNMPAW
jgi:phosphoglycerate dehydrogenase-like enzyme